MHLLQKAFIVVITLLIVACSGREVLAPVTEANWRQTNPNAKFYTVHSGDTLYSIAFRYDQDYRNLARINHLSSPYTLHVGEKIILHEGNYAGKASKVGTKSAKSRNILNKQRKLVAHKPIYNKVYNNKGKINYWRWPTRGTVINKYNPKLAKKGIDIKGSRGQPVYACATGVVAYAGNGLQGYGNLIIIKHNNTYLSAYGNNLRNLVKEGQQVNAGQVIAKMGARGRHTYATHFEIRKDGKPVNPLRYLPSIPN